MYWNEIDRILIDPDYNVRFISNSKILKLSLAQFRKQGEFFGRINKYAEEKISKTIHFFDVTEIRKTNRLVLLVPLLIGIFLLIQEYFIFVGLVLGLICGLQRVSKLMNRLHMKDKVIDKLVSFMLIYITTFWIVRMNTVQVENILRVIILLIAWMTGTKIIYAIFKGKIQNRIEETELTIDDGKSNALKST
ncbi:MAG: hypothetical protein KAX49_16120 [Halanaerobiales bacterium]|nr:hypothetical protein [Halanaerobiales bacterium]